MAQLVTLAHRVSSIHAKYAKIHDALFALSFFRKRTKRSGEETSIHSEYEIELKQLAAKLSEISAMLSDGTPLEPRTTFSREFSAALDEYIGALSKSIIRLAEICQHRYSWEKGGLTFDSDQSRQDRTSYDESIQHYKRLGAKLNQLVTRL